MASVDVILEILKKPSIGDVVAEMFVLLGPFWFAFLLGIMVGWTWKPRWASLGNCKFEIPVPSSPSAFISSSMRDFASNLRMETPSAFIPSSMRDFASNLRMETQSAIISSSMRDFASTLRMETSILGGQSFGPSSNNITIQKEQNILPSPEIVNSSSSKLKEEDSPDITDEDLEHLCHLVDRKDGGPAWKHMMDHSTSSMSNQAWQRDMEDGLPQFCSRTVYEDATPEQLRDFFWDDDFRMKWDDMLVNASILEECPTTGTMMVQWVRKFPIFCSDREYIIGRRIWESGRAYYCITKGVPCHSVPRKDKPRRVDLYYSSWYIQAVESRKGNGELSACEVLLFHHEDMGIPWEIAKFGVRRGMWGAVKNIERGFRRYQRERVAGAPLSRHAFMAQVNTKIDLDYLQCLEKGEGAKETEVPELEEKPGPDGAPNIAKLLIIGGVIAVACRLDRGLVTKGIILSMARRFGKIGRETSSRT